jgi:hypothetical protein
MFFVVANPPKQEQQPFSDPLPRAVFLHADIKRNNHVMTMHDDELSTVLMGYRKHFFPDLTVRTWTKAVRRKGKVPGMIGKDPRPPLTFATTHSQEPILALFIPYCV